MIMNHNLLWCAKVDPVKLHKQFTLNKPNNICLSNQSEVEKVPLSQW